MLEALSRPTEVSPGRGLRTHIPLDTFQIELNKHGETCLHALADMICLDEAMPHATRKHTGSQPT